MQKDRAPRIRRKPTLTILREELKFLKSFKDIQFFVQKASYVLPRVLGTVHRWTEVPPSIQIEPTLQCNADCITCPRSKGTRKVGAMDWNLFKKIIDDSATSGVKRVQLFLFGEPLLHPKLIEMIQYIKHKRLGFHLTTNGMLMTPELGEALLRSGVTSLDYVTFSILGYSREMHEKIQRGISHDRVVSNVENFVAARKRLGVNGPVVETVFYSIPENQHELGDFLDHWGKIADHAINGGNASEAFMGRNMPRKRRTKTCTQLWERMAVQWNGDVVLCGEDLNGDYVVGNLREQTITEVWTGEKLTRLKQLHKEARFAEIPICQFCDW